MIYSYTHPFILFFNNHLLSTYYVPRMILGAEAIEVKKNTQKPVLLELLTRGERQ